LTVGHRLFNLRADKVEKKEVDCEINNPESTVEKKKFKYRGKKVLG